MIRINMCSFLKGSRGKVFRVKNSYVWLSFRVGTAIRAFFGWRDASGTSPAKISTKEYALSTLHPLHTGARTRTHAT